MTTTDRIIKQVMGLVTGFAAGVVSAAWIVSLIPAIVTTVVMVLFLAISAVLEEGSKALWEERRKPE